MEHLITDLLDIYVYTIVDDFLKIIGHVGTKRSALGEPPKLNDSEVLFILLMASLEYGGNIRKSQDAMYRYGNIKSKLDKSQLNRRLHKLLPQLLMLHALIADLRKAQNTDYKIDSFPLAVCHNIRIPRSRILTGEQYRGYNSSKRVYFYGFKAHCITAADGSIVEFELAPGKYEDKIGFSLLNFDLPKGSNLYADKAYNYYIREDELKQIGIELQPIRKANSKKDDNTRAFNFVREHYRKGIETTFSVLVQLFARKIHAVRQEGLVMKILAFVIAHNILIV